MQTLFIYDDLGKIFNYVTGSFDVPVGLQYIIDIIPENKFPIKVNVESEVHFVEYGIHPKSRVEELEEIISEQEAALFEIGEMLHVLMSGGENE